MTSFAWWLSCAVGFLSLSQEILWVRAIGFVQGGAPTAFAFVLTLYLVGIAAGAAVGRRLCTESTDPSADPQNTALRSAALCMTAAWVLLAAAVVDALPTLLGALIAYRGGAVELRHILPPAALILLTAALKSVLFPIAHHLGSSRSGAHVGSSVSKIYFGNILGSTLGPIVTGFVLLDVWSLDRCFFAVAWCTWLLAVACGVRARQTRPAFRIAVIGGATALVALGVSAPGFVRAAGETWYAENADGRPVQGQIARVIENKHGVIHTVRGNGPYGDVVYGGNIYDGRINVDVTIRGNGLDRLYVLAALHDRPRRVLVIGLSGGAWTRALAGFSGVEHIDVVEINPGYLDLIASYPAVAPVLSDEHIAIHIDDARQWLRRRRDERFDLIVMNTTFHWRANATALLSVEFLRALRAHLNPGGILAFNTTESLDAFRTAAEAFPHAYGYGSFAYASEGPLAIDAGAAEERLGRARVGQAPVFRPGDFAEGGPGHRLANTLLRPVSDMLEAGRRPSGVVTDVNMLTEYRHGKRVDVTPLRWVLPAPEK